MRILLCFGTRPEAIKMAPVYFQLIKKGMTAKICVTGQHREMLDQVLDFFEIVPDFDLNLMTEDQSLNTLAGKVLFELEKILVANAFDLVLIHGDTTTSTMAALASFHHQIPVGHVEAGLRTYNRRAPFPEEVNRQINSRIVDFHFAPTVKDQNNLVSEQIEKTKILVTGNTIVDAINLALIKVKEKSMTGPIVEAKNGSAQKKFILVTCHRRENFGLGLENICHALLELSENKEIEIIFPVHRNPNVQLTVEKILKDKMNINLIAPVTYPEMILLMQRCDLVISDSGGIQEEAPSFGKKVLVLREYSERMEGVEGGHSILVGTNKNKIVSAAVEALAQMGIETKNPNPFGDGKASERIVNFILEKLCQKPV